MAYDRFRKDLDETGIPTEIAALERIHLYIDKTAYRIEGKDCEKDIVCPINSERYEVKYGNKGVINFSVEVSINGKPSGLRVTKADWWIIYAKNKFFVIDIMVLNGLCNNLQETGYEIDGNMVGLKLLSLNDLRDNVKVIWD